MKSYSISYYVTALYLSLGPISWFQGVPVGPIKRILLALVVLLNYKSFMPKQSKGILLFLLVLLSVYITSTLYKEVDYTMRFLGIIENFIMFTVGYNFLKNRRIDNHFLRIVLFSVSIASILTISNFLISIPNWHAPSQYATLDAQSLQGRMYYMQKLYETGFSWNRNGWGISLALYFPLCLLMYKHNKKMTYLLMFLLFTSICLSSTRNGIVSSLIPFIIFMYFVNKENKSRLIKSLFVLAVVIVIVSYNFEIISHYLRLDVEDVSAGRSSQYLAIPLMYANMGFFGLGLDGSRQYVYLVTGDIYQIHNTYLCTLFEYGWIPGISVFVIALLSMRQFFKSLDIKKYTVFCMNLIIIGGLITAMFEPQAVFGNLGGSCLWWFSLGVTMFSNNNNVAHHE